MKGFRWPEPVPFNWALDWFNTDLARDTAGGTPSSMDRPCRREKKTKLSFEALSAALQPGRELFARAWIQRSNGLLLLLGNVVPLWETMLASIRTRRGGDPCDHAADAG